MESRIKLAEAMGYKQDDKWAAWILQVSDKEREIVRDPDLLPDPYTDANDDYSVLVWMREHHKWQEFKPALGKLREESIYWRNSQFTWMYQIGDYARAALKVIDDE